MTDFAAWLISTYQKANTPMGDLARDMAYDRPPAFKSKKHLLAYLQDHGASHQVLVLASQAWDQWAEARRKGK